MGGGRILVVDDDATIREALATLLAMEGYRVETAADGAEALHAVAGELPALVILDMHMPTVDGWAFAKAVRAQGFNPPILVVTATATSAERAAREIAAAGFMAKPFNISELLEAVEKLCTP
jgi:DNA-binding response OmpR family regulator